MNDSQKESLIKLAEALQECLPALYNIIGGERIVDLGKALNEVKSVMKE